MSLEGHELPRHLAERAAVMPPRATAPSRDQGGRGGPKGDIAGPDTGPADCGDNNFTAVAQIWYRFHGVRKN